MRCSRTQIDKKIYIYSFSIRLKKKKKEERVIANMEKHQPDATKGSVWLQLKQSNYENYT